MSTELKRETGAGEGPIVEMPLPGNGKSTLFHSAILSIAAHASVLWVGLAPGAPADAPQLRIAATLVSLDRKLAQAPPQRAIPDVRRAADSPPADPVIGRAEKDSARAAEFSPLPIDSPARYFASDDLDKRAFPLAEVDFPYPGISGEGGQGTLELTVYVGMQGAVDHVQIDYASVGQEIIDRAVESLLATPFSPAELDGHAVGARLRLAVDYALVVP